MKSLVCTFTGKHDPEKVTVRIMNRIHSYDMCSRCKAVIPPKREDESAPYISPRIKKFSEQYDKRPTLETV